MCPGTSGLAGGGVRKNRCMLEGPAKVAVLSPQQVVVEGFTAMLNRHPGQVQVVDIVLSPDHEEPDVVLYDVVSLAEGDGADLDHLVKKAACVVFAVGRDLRPDLVSQALTRGADGFFSLGVSETELLEAIESTLTGWQIGDEGPDPVVGSSGSAQWANRLGSDVGLSDREIQVLALVARGFSNDEIAQHTYLTVNTVKTYIRSAYRKIGAPTRSQAAVWALQHGFTTVPGPDKPPPPPPEPNTAD